MQGRHGSPVVSIIIPAYQTAAYIGETLDSVFAQTFTDFEVIVVNDGSPDTPELERAVQPFLSKIAYLTQPNGGPSAARNAALAVARGEFIAFLDGDDIWYSHYLERQLAVLREGAFDLIYANSELFGQDAPQGKTVMDVNPSRGAVTVESLVDETCIVVTSCTIARREPVMRCGMFDESLRFCEDLDLWIRLALSGARLTYQEIILARRRLHGASQTSKVVSCLKGVFPVYDKLQKHPAATSSVLAAVERMRNIYLLNLSRYLGKQYLRERKYRDARREFESANRLNPSPKFRAIVLMLRICPPLVLLADQISEGRMRRRKTRQSA